MRPLVTVREEGSGFLAGWAKRLSWSVVAEAFQTSWDRVFRSVDMAVTWGLEHRDLEGVEAIWVDEVVWHKGYKFLTVVFRSRALRPYFYACPLCIPLCVAALDSPWYTLNSGR